jgi:hypothetical protein
VPRDVKVYPGASHAFLNQFDGGLWVLGRIQGHEL